METKVYYEWFTVKGAETHRVAKLEVQAARSGNTHRAKFWSRHESKRVEGKAGGWGYCKASAATCDAVCKLWPDIKDFGGHGMATALEVITAKIQTQYADHVYVVGSEFWK